jgi:hypothetical protein
MTKPEAKQLLIAELETKKPYEVRYSTDCAECGEEMYSGDECFYIGNERVCDSCRLDLVTFLEENL